jgi:hypothetical protein
MQIYFDACCFTRPFDDQSIDRNRLEAEAVLTIMRHIYSGEWTMTGSEVLELEIANTVDVEKREYSESFLALCSHSVIVGQHEVDRAANLVRLGFKGMDALHIACAEKARCGVMLTTDDPLLKRALKCRKMIAVRIANPLAWIEEQVEHG